MKNSPHEGDLGILAASGVAPPAAAADLDEGLAGGTDLGVTEADGVVSTAFAADPMCRRKVKD